MRSLPMGEDLEDVDADEAPLTDSQLAEIHQPVTVGPIGLIAQWLTSAVEGARRYAVE
ncbi:MAG: hypothetical protein M3O70_05080 [Actinomycetota bacterium]|nr:hypothetical protein [Actinomycetota bacterium]